MGIEPSTSKWYKTQKPAYWWNKGKHLCLAFACPVLFSRAAGGRVLEFSVCNHEHAIIHPHCCHNRLLNTGIMGSLHSTVTLTPNSGSWLNVARDQRKRLQQNSKHFCLDPHRMKLLDRLLCYYNFNEKLMKAFSPFGCSSNAILSQQKCVINLWSYIIAI